MSTGIDVRGLRVGHGAIEALHGVTMSFPLGSVVALLGSNGAGKSSLLRAIAGNLPVNDGTITWQGNDITRLPVRRRIASGLTLVPDGMNVFPALSVTENLAVFGGGAPVDAVFEVFPELADKGAQRAGTLSGGERQMLALGRLLLRPGAAVLLDEASSGLSAGAVERLYGVIDRLATPDRVIIVVEQYQADIVHRADLVYLLSRGRVAWAGEARELIDGRSPLPAG